MNAKLLVLPALALSAAAVLLAPLKPSRAFSKSGGKLDETQRAVRVFNNFADATANDNTTPDSQFPGRTGAELAIWKAIVEWGSALHGDGSGDPLASNALGSGGANFDAMWSGDAAGIGPTNSNIISALASCTPGDLGFTELPISDGWRMRLCDTMVWDDGPGAVPNRFDIQSVVTTLYGFALGLGQSGDSAATMFATTPAGETKKRSIADDDIAGVQCLYGLASATKPSIVATVASAGTLTIFGTNFHASANEVWFTSAAATPVLADPIQRVTGVASSSGGTVISVTIPAGAGAGDVMIKIPGTGGATLSNAFPTDLVGSFGTIPPPRVTSVTPATIDALIPGTAQTITIGGTQLDLATSLLLDGSPIAAARYTLVDPATITLDMPQASTLGAHTLGVSDGTTTDNFPITVVAPATPQYELGTGDALNVVDRDNGLTFILGGQPGHLQRLYASVSNVPSTNAFVSLALGNHFTSLINGGAFVIPAAGWLQVTVPTSALPDPGPGGLTLYSQTLDQHLPTPFPVSNLQSIVLVQ